MPRSFHRVPSSFFTAGARRWMLISVVLLATLGLSLTGSRAQEATPISDDVAAMLPTAVALPAATPVAGDQIRVVTTTSILADLVRQVGGDRVAAESLLPANADPHDFEAAPEDLGAIEDAALVVRHGLGLDDWADTLLETAGDLKVVVATDGVPVLTGEGFESGDPHVWFDPTRTATMVATIASALAGVDPEGATTYDARTKDYRAQLADLDAAIARAIETIPTEQRVLVTTHNVLGYYADRYGLTVVGTIIPGMETSSEPSAKDVATLLETIEAEGVPAIFAENTANPAFAQELADQAGVTLVDDLYTDSLGGPGSGAETYFDLMRTDTILIVEALR